MALFSKRYLGIDIGASSIKLVEVSVLGKRKKLENYVEFQLPSTASAVKTFHGESLLLLSDEVSEILQAVFKKAKVPLPIPITCINNDVATAACGERP